MKVRNCLFLAFLFVFASCAKKKDGDSSFGAIVHPCDPATMDEDPWNCGACTTLEENYVCDMDTSDISTSPATACVDGECRCGDGPPCDLREQFAGGVVECRFGRCLVADESAPYCEMDHECGDGFVCVAAHCVRMNCVPEDCDGLDNDCDGLVDESDSGTPLTGWCVGEEAADPSEAPLPPCQFGYRVCSGGAWDECIGDVGPRSEQGLMGCDGEDNDCDGCIDGTLSGGICEGAETVNLDIVFVLDISGSMSMNIQAMKDAVHDYSELFPQNPAYRFGIVELAPSSFGGNVDDRPMLVQSLTDFSTFETALIAVPLNGGGSEPQYDAVYELATNEMEIGWRDGSTRVIIVFTDEEGQSYRDRHGLSVVDEAAMCASLTHGEVLVFFTNMLHSADFDECSIIFEISADKTLMLQDLKTVIQDPC